MINSWLRRILGLANKRIRGEEKEERWISLGSLSFYHLASRRGRMARRRTKRAAESLANYEAETYLTSHLHRINARLRGSLFTVPRPYGTKCATTFYDTPRHRALNHLWSPCHSRELLDYTCTGTCLILFCFMRNKMSVKRNETGSFRRVSKDSWIKFSH